MAAAAEAEESRDIAGLKLGGVCCKIHVDCALASARVLATCARNEAAKPLRLTCGNKEARKPSCRVARKASAGIAR